MPGLETNVLNRVTACHRKTSALGPFTHETHTVASQKQLEGTRDNGKDHPHSKITPPTSRMVAGGKQCYHRSTITPTKTCSANLYRHIKRRVGRSLKRAHGKGKLVASRKQAAHKLPRVKGSLSGLKRISGPLYQHYNIVLIATDNTTVVAYVNKEGGMNSGPLCTLLWRILTWCTRNAVTLKARHIPGHLNVIADKLSRLGQTIQTEWSLNPEVFQAICNRWHRPQVDLFATRFNNKLPQFVSGPRPPSMGSGCSQPVMGRTGPIRLPTGSHLGQSGGEVVRLPVQQNDTDCTRVAKHALVLGSGSYVQSDPPVPAQPAQSANSTIQPDLTQKSVKSQPPCLAPRATTIKEQGFSEAVAARIEAPQRRSTRSVYEAKWTIFTKWCLSNQVDVRAPPLKAIADFLLFLFQDRKLQPGTIGGYRSAKAGKLGNSPTNISTDENLTRLLYSFHRDRPKGRRGIPSWNLSLVLHQLTKAPFEPLKEASLKHLTFKTVFLLALGSGKRRSEIHAWLHKNIRHQADWSKVSLYPSPSFLSKNQLAKEGPDSVALVVIPALAPTLDKSLKGDRSLCPVRALRYYLDRTSDRR